MENYRGKFGSYPSGGNAQIMNALMGSNPEKFMFIELGVHSTNRSGEFIDPWRTPYRITLDGTNGVVIRSAGINKIFGDKDDITITRSDMLK